MTGRADVLADVLGRETDPSAHLFEPLPGASNVGRGDCRHCEKPRADHPGAKCGTQSCAEQAAVRVFWPGKTTDMCIACADRALGVAGALGLQLAIEALLCL